jgi:succinate dehydrogenase/fumarate reductase cytochrome b subunit
MTTAAPVSAQNIKLSLHLRIAPGLIGLFYPVLVWSIAAWSPFALLLTLLAPAACLYLAFLLAQTNTYRRATRIAYFAIGAPALYSFLGGWLDSQRWIPYRANGVWVLLWCVLLLLTLIERPVAADNADVRPAKLAVAHGISAALITIFAAAHLSNHLAGVLGGETHIAIMRHLRVIYRSPVVESLLLACVLFQVASGWVLLAYRTRKPFSGWIDTVQNASGMYLLLFFASHVSAVMRARYLRHIDTNWVWLTADNLLKDPWSVRLVPYYFLGVLALAVHGACGVRHVLAVHEQPHLADRAFAAIVAGGGVVAVVIIVALVAGSLSH